MTKTDFAELKEKLIVQGQSTGGVRFQSKQDKAIISELIDSIKSQSEAIQNINNKSGIDIKMVEYETVWGDPNNVKQTLEITQKVREKHFTEICSTLSETTARLQKLRDGK